MITFIAESPSVRLNSPLFGQSNQIAGGVGAYSDYSSNRHLEFQLRFRFW